MDADTSGSCPAQPRRKPERRGNGFPDPRARAATVHPHNSTKSRHKPVTGLPYALWDCRRKKQAQTRASTPEPATGNGDPAVHVAHNQTTSVNGTFIVLTVTEPPPEARRMRDFARQCLQAVYSDVQSRRTFVGKSRTANFKP